MTAVFYVCLGIFGFSLLILFAAKTARRRKGRRIATPSLETTEDGGEPMIPPGGFRAGRSGWNWSGLIKVVGSLAALIAILYFLPSWIYGHNTATTAQELDCFSHAPDKPDTPSEKWVSTDWSIGVVARSDAPKDLDGYKTPPCGASFLDLHRHRLISLEIIDCTPGDTVYFQCWGKWELRDERLIPLRNGYFYWVIGSGHFPFKAIVYGTEDLQAWVVRDDVLKGGDKFTAHRD